MSVNPESSHEIVQVANESLDSSQGLLDSKTTRAAARN